MKKMISIASMAIFVMILLTSCGTGGLDGTYIPKNNAAKSNYIAKLVFKDEKVSFFDKVFPKNTVKIYYGTMGITMPTAIELTYSLKGNSLIIEGGIPGVNGQSIELTYNKNRDEISLNMDYAFDMLGGLASQLGKANGENVDGKQVSNALKSEIEKEITPVWCKEGSASCICNDLSNNRGGEDNGGKPVTESPVSSSPYQPNVFNQELAERLALYAEYAYHQKEITNQLTIDGYTDAFYYDNQDENGIGYALAHKKVKDGNELVVAIRGTWGKEWFGDMEVGKDSERHKSFEMANKRVQVAIYEYINKYKIENINFLITGHSRGAAVANLLAVDLNEKNVVTTVTDMNNVKGIFAYTFATPNCTKKVKSYDNIFNFCFLDDFVPQVPLDTSFSGWGYGKSGISYPAVAENLYKNNSEFRQLQLIFIRTQQNREPIFNYDATQKVLLEFHEAATSVDLYYTKDLKMGMDIPNKIPLYKFMRNYVAQGTLDADGGKTILGWTPIPESSAIIGLKGKAENLLGDVDIHIQEIAKFFIDKKRNVAQEYIGDTHNPHTYYNALKSNGFLTK